MGCKHYFMCRELEGRTNKNCDYFFVHHSAKASTVPSCREYDSSELSSVSFAKLCSKPTLMLLCVASILWPRVRMNGTHAERILNSTAEFIVLSVPRNHMKNLKTTHRTPTHSNRIYFLFHFPALFSIFGKYANSKRWCGRCLPCVYRFPVIPCLKNLLCSLAPERGHKIIIYYFESHRNQFTIYQNLYAPRIRIEVKLSGSQITIASFYEKWQKQCRMICRHRLATPFPHSTPMRSLWVNTVSIFSGHNQWLSMSFHLRLKNRHVFHIKINVCRKHNVAGTSTNISMLAVINPIFELCRFHRKIQFFSKIEN